MSKALRAKNQKHSIMYILDVIMPVQLLQALLPVFQSDSSTLSVEGDFSQLDAQLLDNVTITDWPSSGHNRFAQIPLTQHNVEALIESILPRIGIHTRVYHVKVKRAGKLLF